MEEVSFTMHEMEYGGGEVQGVAFPTMLPLRSENFEEYKKLANDCFYKMRKELDIRPYDGHCFSLAPFEELSLNTYLLLEGSAIIAAVSITDTHIENVFVRPDRQGRGLGRMMTSFALAYMQARDAQNIKLTVAKWNKAAIGLYESMGFKITKTSLIKGENRLIDGQWQFNFVAAEGLHIR